MTLMMASLMLHANVKPTLTTIITRMHDNSNVHAVDDINTKDHACEAGAYPLKWAVTISGVAEKCTLCTNTERASGWALGAAATL